MSKPTEITISPNTLKNQLEQLSFAALCQRIMSQDETISQLQDQVSSLTHEVSKREAAITKLTNSHQTMKQRVMDLVKLEGPLHETLKGVVHILKSKQIRSAEEERVLSQVEHCGILMSTFQGWNSSSRLSVDGSRPSEVSFPVVERRGSGRRASFVLRPNHVLQTSDNPMIQHLLLFPLFASFPWDALEQIAANCFEMRTQAGQTIISKGEEGMEIYFLTQGSIDIVVSEGNLHAIHSPVFFGELGVLSKSQQRTATVLAKSDVVITVVTKQFLHELANKLPAVRKLMEDFAINEELWWTQQRYVVTQEKFGEEFVNDVARQGIKKLDVFSEAPEEFVDKLAATMKMLRFQANENIISINDPADCMYFIIEGSVQVIGATGTVHAEMQSGTSFGEVGILLKMKRTASIKAKQECHVFQLTTQNLEKVVVIYPAMKEKLKSAADERFALFKLRTNTSSIVQQPDQFDIEVGEQSLAKLGIFSGVDPSVISELAALMIRKTWNKGELIIRCGETGTSMFFLAAGNADVISEFGELLESVKGPSAYFGEVSLLEHVPRIASVKCASICSTYELRKDDFKAVIIKYPEIARHIKETAFNRMQQYLMRNILA
ncbi:cyclic nucleotide-binding-like protein [Obelidium mucronatum]|nr:cyclic nucleotide-binding-like protein [Obelidium mucronatum]